jgi:serine phosphatase RsbU (regulator of sigma subunit)
MNPSLYAYKKRYEVNELNLLARGDILLLCTDGLTEHDDGRYYPGRLEQLLADHPQAPAKEICQRMKEDLLSRAAPLDDISFVVIRRTA